MFMQAGFAFLEIGFSRGKNAGTVIAKILTNFSIAAIAVLGRAASPSPSAAPATIIGDTRLLPARLRRPADGVPGRWACPDATIESKWFFQFVFCAVSLAIVWGTTLERIKFGVYVIYASSSRRSSTRSARTGSSAAAGCRDQRRHAGLRRLDGVHLIGATGALAALLLLGPRRGKYGPDGKPRAIPGHNMPLFGLGVLILWLGWFGFNPGSTLGALDGRFAEVVARHAAGRRGRRARRDPRRPTGRPRRSTSAWPATARSPRSSRITAPVGLRGARGRRRSSASSPASSSSLGVYAIDKKLDDPVGALSAHGLAGIWGTLACGLFTAPRLAEYNGFGEAGPVLHAARSSSSASRRSAS